MKNKKIIFIVLAILIIIAILVTVIVKKANVGEEKETENIKSFETEKMNLMLKDVATVGKYLIAEYEINVNDSDEAEFNDEVSYMDGLEYKVQRELRIDGKKILDITDENEQIAYKISDTQARIYDVVDISKITLNENYNLEVDFFDFSSSTIDEVEIDEEDNNDDKLYVNQIGLEKVGEIKLTLNKAETDKEATLTENTNIYEQENISMKIDCEIEMNSAKFLICDTEFKIMSSDYSTNEFNINVQDENGNTLDINKSQNIALENKDDFSILKLNTILAFIGENKDLKKVRLQPYTYNVNESGDKKWYSIENQSYTASNSNNGIVKITKISTEESSVNFYFTRSGFIPSEDPIILVRNSKNQTEYIKPDELEKIATNQYMAKFYVVSVDDEEIEEFETISLIGTEKAEFTILENNLVTLYGDGNIIDI